jgi:hypothetical protein
MMCSLCFLLFVMCSLCFLLFVMFSLCFLLFVMCSLCFLLLLCLKSRPGTAKSTFYFSGGIDEVRVWSGTRAAPQILSDMFDTISPTNAAATASLLLYLPCNDRADSIVVSDASGSFIPTLQPAGLAGGVPTFQAVAVDTSNPDSSAYFRSAMDRPTSVRLNFGVQLVTISSSRNSSESAFFVLEMQKANTIVVSVIDPNPSDTPLIGAPPSYPSPGGLPNGAVVQPQVMSAAAYSTPALEGVVFSRTLSWLPSFDSEWLIPSGGLLVSLPLTEVASNPYAPGDALPARTSAISVKLYVAAPPEFLSTPPLSSLREVQITAFIGLEVAFEVRARDRNSDEQLLLRVAYDPGLPNFATISPPSSDGFGSALVSRSFAWTPTCKQARRHSIVFDAAAGGLITQQHVQVTVVAPTPVLIGFNSSTLLSAPGCEVEMVVDAADSSPQLRALGLASYGHVFTYNLSDVSLGLPPLTLPRSDLVVSALTNAYGGNSAVLRVFPEFAHGGRTYLMCVSVKDACGISLGITRCREILVQSCKICAWQGATLSVLAHRFGTDANSLYAVNPLLPNPDIIEVNSIVNIGGLHVSTEGQTLAAVADMFQTAVDALRLGNPAFSHSNSSTTLSVGTAICIISRVCAAEQNCASDSCGN